MHLDEAVGTYLTYMRGGPIVEGTTRLQKETVVKAVRGDSQAFSDLYNDYYKSIVNTASRHARSRGDVEDVVQDIFMKVQQGHDTFKKVADQIEKGQIPPQKMWSTILRSVINRLKDVARNRARKSTGALTTEPPARQRHTGMSREMKKILRDEVSKALKSSSLKTDERAFVQKFLGGGEDLLDIERFKGKMGIHATGETHGDLAQTVWPHLSKTAASTKGKRAFDKFLGHLRGSVKLKSLIGEDERARSRFFNAHIRPLVAEEDMDLFEIAFSHKLIEGATHDASAVGALVLSWIQEAFEDSNGEEEGQSDGQP